MTYNCLCNFHGYFLNFFIITIDSKLISENLITNSTLQQYKKTNLMVIKPQMFNF